MAQRRRAEEGGGDLKLKMTAEQERKAEEKIQRGLVSVIEGILEDAEVAPESSPIYGAHLVSAVEELKPYILAAKKHGVNNDIIRSLDERYIRLTAKAPKISRSKHP